MARPKQSAARGGRASRHPSGHAKQPPQVQRSSHFSLQEEALNTGRHHSDWNSNTGLRYQPVAFVSAGATTLTEVHEELINAEEELEQDENTMMSKQPLSSMGLGEMIQPEDFTPSPEKKLAVSVGKSDSRHHVQPRRLSAEAAPFQPTPTQIQGISSNFFFVDTQGTKPDIKPRAPPQIRSDMPPSDSEDEVVFRGRNPPPPTITRRVVDDPVAPIVEAPVFTDKTNALVANNKHWDDTPDDWVHRSKPGIGWSQPRLPYNTAKKPQQLMFPAQNEEEEAVRDYIENIQAQQLDGSGSDLMATFEQRDLGTEIISLSVNMGNCDSTSSEDEDGNRIQSGKEPAASVPDEDSDSEDEDQSEDESEDEGEDDDDDDSVLDDIDLIERKMARLDDENLARLFSKQAELGITSDELLIFDDEDAMIAAAVAKEARSYSRNSAKSARKSKKSFPDASLMADVLDQDPYGGFDIMDFEQPSLRRRKKSRKGDLPFQVSDSELEATLTKAWNKDRETKKAKKEEREALRAEGLLGHKNKYKNLRTTVNMEEKYKQGFNLTDLKDEMRDFMNSTQDRLSLPPMHKEHRKRIHELAAVFNLGTKSIGAGKSRYTVIAKKRRTLQWNEAAFDARAHKIEKGFFPRLDKSAASKGKMGGKVRAFGGGGGAGVRYNDGDVVGHAAPAIGEESRGHKIMMKMGWSTGTTLGKDNVGILEPIAHIVKNSRAGLG